MSSTRVFNESVFDSYANLQNFFLRSDAVDQVLSRKDKPFTRVLSPLNPNLDFKWQVCQIATAPFRWILAIVLKIVAKSASCLGATQFAKQVKTTSQYLWAGFDLYSEETTKLFRIKDAVNNPNAEGEIVNKTPFIPERRITDLRVRKKTLCSVFKGVEFDHHKGVCRGISDWFIYLYLNTKDQFSDPRSHMAALGRQFAGGGGMDPTLLQSLHLKKGKLLNTKIGTQAAHTHHQPVTHLYSHTPAQWKSSTKQIVHQLQNLPAGAYGVGLPLHKAAYVKINDKLGYFLDPNDGITEINGDAVGEKLYELISESLKTTGESSEKLPRIQLHVKITPVTLRN